MKKKITTVKLDWKDAFAKATDDVLAILESLHTNLQKHKKTINKEIKVYGKRGSGVEELFSTLLLSADKKLNEIRDVVED